MFENLIKNLTDLWKETKGIKLKLYEANNDLGSDILPPIIHEKSESSEMNFFPKKTKNLNENLMT